MALPSGLFIGLTVEYLPNIYDAGLFRNGKQVPVAAIITAIDAINDEVFLTVFPEGRAIVYRSNVKYLSDIVDDQNGFMLTTDPALTCGAEISGVSVTDQDPGNFTIEFTVPSGSHDVIPFYRINGTTDWLKPNEPGNATVTGEPGVLIFSGLEGTTLYDFKILNVCNNGVESTGYTLTETTILPP